MGIEELPKSGVPGTGTGPAAGAGQAVWAVAALLSGTFGWSGGFAVAGSPAPLRSSLMMPRIPDRI